MRYLLALVLAAALISPAMAKKRSRHHAGTSIVVWGLTAAQLATAKTFADANGIKYRVVGKR